MTPRDSLPDQRGLSAYLATGEGYRSIRRAIDDPGGVTGRKREEALGDWQTRAVMAVLGTANRTTRDSATPDEQSAKGGNDGRHA